MNGKIINSKGDQVGRIRPAEAALCILRGGLRI
jgi:hypothetical protein